MYETASLEITGMQYCHQAIVEAFCEYVESDTVRPEDIYLVAHPDNKYDSGAIGVYWVHPDFSKDDVEALFDKCRIGYVARRNQDEVRESIAPDLSESAFQLRGWMFTEVTDVGNNSPETGLPTFVNLRLTREKS